MPSHKLYKHWWFLSIVRVRVGSFLTLECPVAHRIGLVLGSEIGICWTEFSFIYFIIFIDRWGNSKNWRQSVVPSSGTCCQQFQVAECSLGINTVHLCDGEGDLAHSAAGRHLKSWRERVKLYTVETNKELLKC